MSVKKSKSRFFRALGREYILPKRDELSDRKKRDSQLQTKDESYLKLTELVSNSQILFKATTVFPFILFPDEIIVDKDKVSIVSQTFFAADRRESVLIKNIADCFVDTSLFFGALKITDKYYEDKVMTVNYLKKGEAIRAKDIIQGLVLCHEKGVDISEIKPSELMPYLLEIGKATEN